MDTTQITELLREGVWVAIKLGGPMLVLSMVVGVLIAIFQAVTQIHEQTLSFILKLIVYPDARLTASPGAAGEEARLCLTGRQ